MQIRSLVALAAAGAVTLGGAVAFAQASSATESAQTGVSQPQQFPTGQPTRPRPTWPGMPGMPGQPGQPAPQPTQPAPWPTQPAPQPPAPQPTQPAPWPTQPAPQPTQPAPWPTQPAPQPPAPKPTQPPAPKPTQPPGGGTAEFVKEVTQDSWGTDVVENSKRRTVIVDYYTTWCGACKQVTPWLIKMANTDKKWMLAKCDAEKNPKVASHVRAYPEIEAWQRGVKADRFDNSDLDDAKIRRWLDQILPKGPQL